MPITLAWFAHSLDGRPEGDWEPLAYHLRKVECRSRTARSQVRKLAERGLLGGQ